MSTSTQMALGAAGAAAAIGLACAAKPAAGIYMGEFSVIKKTCAEATPGDVVAFVAGVLDAAPEFTAPGKHDVFVARAPGRLDVMGGIADYSGAVVLQMPVAEACVTAVRQTEDGRVTVVSEQKAPFSVSTQELVAAVATAAKDDYAAARELFASRKAEGGDWAAYVAGTLVVLAAECGFVFPAGAGCTICLQSAVPMGMGVSSSAAVEVATMQAAAAAFGVDVGDYRRKSPAGEEYSTGVKMAILCQKVENLVVGSPCGIMDQMASNLGRQGQLLQLLCRPAEVEGYATIPAGMEVWGLDSGHVHSNVGVDAHGGADYGSVRVGAFMGKKIWNARGKSGRAVSHLTELAPSELDWADFHPPAGPAFPAEVAGAAFLEEHQSHDDAVTEIDPARIYNVADCARHPVDEHHRVRAYASLMSLPAEPGSTLPLLGELMRGSHLSYSRCGIGSSSTDLLVQLAHAAGPAKGVFGAKITGGGSGGTVCVLTQAGGKAAVQEIAAQYAEQHPGQHAPHIFEGSSMGAHQFGFMQLHPVA
jgi:L-arabinokinase